MDKVLKTNGPTKNHKIIKACQTKSKEAAGLTKQTEPLLRQCNQANGP